MRNAYDANKKAWCHFVKQQHIDFETRIKAIENTHSLFIEADRRHRNNTNVTTKIEKKNTKKIPSKWKWTGNINKNPNNANWILRISQYYICRLCAPHMPAKHFCLLFIRALFCDSYHCSAEWFTVVLSPKRTWYCVWRCSAMNYTRNLRFLCV